MRFSQLFGMPSRKTAPDQGYRLVFPRRVDRRRLIRDVAALLGVHPNAVRELHRRYRTLHEEQRYQERFGERKTLNVDEAFVIFAILNLLRPSGPIVEIGTQYGRSTRRILDMLKFLRLTNEVVAFDVDNQVQHFTTDEARCALRT